MDRSLEFKRFEKAQSELAAAWQRLNDASKQASFCDLDLTDIQQAEIDARNEAAVNDAAQHLRNIEDKHADLLAQFLIAPAHVYRRLQRQVDGSERHLRIITTARDLKAINEAANRGLRPLIKPVTPSEEIWSRTIVFQNPETGEIEEGGDLRYFPRDKVQVLEVNYYPYRFPNPYAAYLVPSDLSPGDAVWLDDLIEDHVGSHWNQGPTSRLESCEALWDGKDFCVRYDTAPRREYIG